MEGILPDSWSLPLFSKQVTEAHTPNLVAYTPKTPEQQDWLCLQSMCPEGSQAVSFSKDSQTELPSSAVQGANQPFKDERKHVQLWLLFGEGF